MGVGLSQTAISMYEIDRYIPRLKTLIKILDFAKSKGVDCELQDFIE